MPGALIWHRKPNKRLILSYGAIPKLRQRPSCGKWNLTPTAMKRRRCCNLNTVCYNLTAQASAWYTKCDVYRPPLVRQRNPKRFGVQHCKVSRISPLEYNAAQSFPKFCIRPGALTRVFTVSICSDINRFIYKHCSLIFWCSNLKTISYQLKLFRLL